MAGQHQVQVLGGEGAAAPDLAEGAPHRAQDQQVEEGQQEQERGRDARADQPAHVLHLTEVRLQEHGGEGDPDGHQCHHRRMPEREEEAHGDRIATLLHQLARDVVDGRDVVGIHGVAQPQRIGQHRRRHEDRLVAERDPGPQPCHDVGEDQERVERGDLAPAVGGLVIENAGEEGEKGGKGAQPGDGGRA
ncbi:hypothetical protein D3C86_1244110 [compost metagenome]